MLTTCSVQSGEAHEFVSHLSLVLKASEEAASHGGGPRFLNSAHQHAHVACLHGNSDPRSPNHDECVDTASATQESSMALINTDLWRFTGPNNDASSSQ